MLIQGSRGWGWWGGGGVAQVGGDETWFMLPPFVSSLFSCQFLPCARLCQSLCECVWCKDKFTDGTDPVVTTEQRMQQQAFPDMPRCIRQHMANTIDGFCAYAFHVNIDSYRFGRCIST